MCGLWGSKCASLVIIVQKSRCKPPEAASGRFVRCYDTVTSFLMDFLPPQQPRCAKGPASPPESADGSFVCRQIPASLVVWQRHRDVLYSRVLQLMSRKSLSALAAQLPLKKLHFTRSL